MNDTNRLVQKWSEIGEFVLVKVSSVGLVIPRAIISYTIYFTTNAGNEAFELPILHWVPYDWQNPLGYFVTVTIEYISVAYCLTLIFCGIFFGIGCYLLLFAIIQNPIKTDLKLINENVTSDRNRLMTVKLVARFIEAHSFIKKCVGDYFVVCQIPLLLVFVWSLITICSAMLLIQMQMHDPNPVVIFLISILVSYAFGLMMGVCEFGQRMSNGFGEIDDEIEAFDWYLFPQQIQRMLLIILMEVQITVEFKCFGSISANRKNSKKIIKGAFSYFMTMRQFIK